MCIYKALVQGLAHGTHLVSLSYSYYYYFLFSATNQAVKHFILVSCVPILARVSYLQAILYFAINHILFILLPASSLWLKSQESFPVTG